MTKTVKDALADISKNVISTGFFDKIRITAEPKTTLIEAIDKDKQVILKGQTLEPVQDFAGTFGLSNLQLLTSITSDSEYNHKDSVIELVTESLARENLVIPIESDGDSVVIAMNNPNNIEVLDKLRFVRVGCAA